MGHEEKGHHKVETDRTELFGHAGCGNLLSILFKSLFMMLHSYTISISQKHLMYKKCVFNLLNCGFSIELPVLIVK